MTKSILSILFLTVWAALAPAQTSLSNSDLVKLSKSGLSEEFVLNQVEQNGGRLDGEVASLVDMKRAGVSERVLAAVARKAPAREPLNSDSVTSLVKAGFSDGFVLDLLKQRPGKFSLSAARIVELKQAGVSERLLSAMSGQGGSRTLPANSEIHVRLIDSVDSEKDDPGKEYRASLAEAIVIGQEEVAPRGADATVRLAQEKDSGKITGKTELKLDLVAVYVNGKKVPVVTSSVTEYSSSRGARTAKSAAAVGAVGAIIGAIAGGGKGAAIGAGAGAAAGTGAQVFMKGQRVRVPSETLLTFTTQDAVALP